MSSQVFYRKWRPQTLSEVVGQEAVTRTLLNALAGNRLSHAYLFCGPRGTGKTSTARILAKAINCLSNGKGEPCNSCSMCQAITEARSLDVIEIDAASNTGVDDIRSLREKVNYAPNQARYKVYIIDEVHMLSNAASNALLKTLEEPPPQVFFVLATTESHKILPTIMSRCQRFDFRRLSQSDVVSKLTAICKTEGIRIEPEALSLISRSATGSLRDAENLLEQLVTYYGTDVKLKQVQSLLGITGDQRARELVKNIINNELSAGLTTINNVNSDGLDLKQFNREVVAYLRDLLLIKTGSQDAIDLSAEEVTELKNLAANVPLERILKAVQLFGRVELGFDSYSTLPMELALVDCALASGQDAEEQLPTPQKQAPRQSAVVTPKPRVREAEAPASSAKSEAAKPKPATAPAAEAPAGETPAVVAPAKSQSPPPGGDLEQLKLNWKRIIKQTSPEVSKSPAVAILRSAGVMPIAVEEGTVSLAFKFPVHKEQVEKIENLRVIEKLLSDFLGYTCHVRCVSENNHLLKAALKMGAQIIDVEEK